MTVATPKPLNKKNTFYTTPERLGDSSDRSAEEAGQGKYFCALLHELELGEMHVRYF